MNEFYGLLDLNPVPLKRANSLNPLDISTLITTLNFSMSNSAEQKTVTALLAKTFMQVTLLLQTVMSQEFFWGV